jgi:Na+/H+ antiporter NhaD/arsenite permease-like protein
MGILIAGVIIVIGSLASMCVIHGSKQEQKFIEWVNK